MIGERIKAIRLSITPKMSQTEFGKKLSLSRDAVNNLENGRVEPSGAIVQLISQTFNINPLYLTGESEVMHIPPDEDEEIIDSALASGNPVIKALLLGIVKQPDGWEVLARAILSAADTLREAGIDLDTLKTKKPGD